jgi:hypothetical protein
LALPSCAHARPPAPAAEGSCAPRPIAATVSASALHRSDQSALQTLRKQGIVIARHDACGTAILDGCLGPGQYRSDRDSRWDLDRVVHLSELQGQCSGATHFVLGLNASDASLTLQLAPLPEVRERVERELRADREQRLAEERHAASQRTIGWLLTIAGVATAIGAGAMLVQSSRNNDAIQEGHFSTSDDIRAAEARGRTYDVAAWSLGAASLPMLVFGVPMLLTRPEPSIALEPARPTRVAGAGSPCRGSP